MKNQIKKSNSSYGNWSVRVSPTDIRLFMKKKDAEDFVLKMLDFKYTQELKKQNEIPVFTNCIDGIEKNKY